MWNKCIEDDIVAKRVIDIWNNILEIFEFWQGLRKSKRPSYYQTAYPMVLFLFHNLYSLVREIMFCFIKTAVLIAAKN